MFDRIRKEYLIAAGYLIWMTVFYFIGITTTRLDHFIGVAVVSAFYFIALWFYKKIKEG